MCSHLDLGSSSMGETSEPGVHRCTCHVSGVHRFSRDTRCEARSPRWLNGRARHVLDRSTYDSVCERTKRELLPIGKMLAFRSRVALYALSL